MLPAISTAPLYTAAFIFRTAEEPDAGTLFELSPNQNGTWSEKVLHSFDLNGTDGAFLYGGVIFDTAGNLYGMTYEGGIHFWAMHLRLRHRVRVVAPLRRKLVGENPA